MTPNVPVAMRRWLPTWRALIAVSLVAGYLALSGEAIHCQFVPKGHHEHPGRTSQSVNHATHCLLANHSSATMATTIVIAIPVLYPIGLHRERLHHRDAAPRFALLPARAPPSV